MTLPLNETLGDLKRLPALEAIRRVQGLSLEQLAGGGKVLPFGITFRSLKKLQRRLHESGIPEPGQKHTMCVYVFGPITPTTHCPNMEENRERFLKAALSLFLLGYWPYCPSVPWFPDPHTYNLWYYLILGMDEQIIRGPAKWLYGVKAAWTSFGGNFEEGVAYECEKPIFFETKRDKDYFERKRLEHSSAKTKKLHAVS